MTVDFTPRPDRIQTAVLVIQQQSIDPEAQRQMSIAGHEHASIDADSAVRPEAVR
jgi:hypothetical protein